MRLTFGLDQPIVTDVIGFRALSGPAIALVFTGITSWAVLAVSAVPGQTSPAADGTGSVSGVVEVAVKSSRRLASAGADPGRVGGRQVDRERSAFANVALVLSAVLVAGATAAERAAPAAPARLAIYYGYPSLVNGANGDLERAAQAFGHYDVIVLGDGLEASGDTPGARPGHPEHAFTVRLIDRLHRSARRPLVFGYVDLGNSQSLSINTMVRQIGQWADMKADGIFFDEAGFDYGVRRERQNSVILAAHARGLRAFLNAFQPTDVFGAAAVALNVAGGGNPSAVPPVVGDRDALLLESFAVRNGHPEPPSALAVRTAAAIDGRRRFGTRIYGIATSEGTTDDTALSPYAWWTASLFGLNGYGWGAANYSATTSRLTFVSPPPEEARLRTAEYIGEPELTVPRWRRTTTGGTITVDPVARRGAIVSR